MTQSIEIPRTEEELRLAQFSLDHAAEAVFWLAPDGRFIYANRAACRSLGYTREEFLSGMTVHDIAPGFSREAWPERWEFARARGTLTFDSRHRARDGRTFPVEVTVNHMHFGGKEYHCSFARDISERKRAEEDMRQRTRVALLLQRIAVAANAAAGVEEARQVCLAEVCTRLAWPVGHVYVPAADGTGELESSRQWYLDRPQLWDEWRRQSEATRPAPLEGLPGRVLVGGESAWAADLSQEPAARREAARVCGLRSGFAFPVLIGRQVVAVFEFFSDAATEADSRILDTAGRIGRQLGLTFERMRAEEALRESETKYRMLFDAADPIFIFDQETRLFLDCNQTALDHYGYSLTELRRMTPVDLHPPDEMPRVERNIGDREDTTPQRYAHMTRGGERLDVEIRSVAIQYKGHAAWLSVVRDITERRRAEEERRSLEAQIQHAQKLESLGVLAGGIAHDFNNLLVGILGYSSLALSELPEDSAARARLSQVVASAQRAGDLVKQLLAYSGKGAFEVKTVDVNAAVEEVNHLLEHSISKKATLRYRFPEEPLYVKVDVSQLHQVIMNLIINASDALGEEPGVIEVRAGAKRVDPSDVTGVVSLDDLPEGEYVFMEVSDTGVGMDEATRRKIFDPFFTTKFTGRGLGLAAVLGIIRGHQGAIRVTSEVGQGTKVRFFLPRAAATEEETEAPRAAAAPMSIRLPSRRVLVVDDEPMVREFATDVLSAAGIEVDVAVDGAEAVDVFRRRADDIAVVLLDMTMPVMNGEETLRELRRIRPDVKAVLSSGYSEQDASSKFAGGEAAGFLQKPYTPQQLLLKIREIL